MDRFIKVTVVLSGLHCWPEAPENRKYLRDLHRHRFYITATAPVSHNERDIEFHNLQTKIYGLFPNPNRDGLLNFGAMSCESIGEDILEKIPQLAQVEVSEDEECSAVVYRHRATPEKRSPLHFVTLCGSTKFREEYDMAEFLLEKLGFAVLTVGGYMHAGKIPLSEAEKKNADALHKAKIKASNSIVVLNKDGYFGESTKSEIFYANELGKDIFFLQGNSAWIGDGSIRGRNILAIHPMAVKDKKYWEMREQFPFILRQSLYDFALDMEAKLQQEDRKKGHNGWKNRSIHPDLFNGMLEEADELLETIEDEDPSWNEMKGEAVDVANFAMMIYDNAKEPTDGNHTVE